MYEKVKKFTKFVCTGSSQRIIATIFALICILYLAYNGAFYDFFCYPEETYQRLEEEADALIKTHSFETDYDLVITNYDFNTKTLLMELSSSSSYAKLDIKIYNYGKSNQEYYRDREYNSSVYYILNHVFGLLMLTVFFSVLGVLFILISANAIQLIAFIIHKIIQATRKK